MATKLKAAALTLLGAIVAAGENGTFAAAADLKELVKGKYVETNEGATNDAGEIAVRATSEGVAHFNEQPKAEAAPASKPAFSLDDGVPVPAVTGRGRSGTSVYPFDDMQPGQSFFVENTADRPNAAKSMASTLSSANARYAEVIEGEFDTKQVKNKETGEVETVRVPKTRQVRKFIVRSVSENGVEGARIWRQF